MFRKAGHTYTLREEDFEFILQHRLNYLQQLRLKIRTFYDNEGAERYYQLLLKCSIWFVTVAQNRGGLYPENVLKTNFV